MNTNHGRPNHLAPYKSEIGVTDDAKLVHAGRGEGRDTPTQCVIPLWYGIIVVKA